MVIEEAARGERPNHTHDVKIIKPIRIKSACIKCQPLESRKMVVRQTARIS